MLGRVGLSVLAVLRSRRPECGRNPRWDWEVYGFDACSRCCAAEVGSPHTQGTAINLLDQRSVAAVTVLGIRNGLRDSTRGWAGPRN